MTVNRNSAITPDILLCIKKLKMSDRDHRFLGQHALLCFSACFIRPTCLQNKSLMRTNISPGTLLCSTLTVRWQSVSGGPRPSNAGNEKSGSHYQPSTLTPFAPVSAVCQALCAAVHQSPKAPAFPMSGAVFDKKLMAVTQGEGHLSGHSFRQGGACWALSQNIPGEIIKIMGDCKSTVYMSYLDQLPQPVLDYYRVAFSPHTLTYM